MEPCPVAMLLPQFKMILFQMATKVAHTAIFRLKCAIQTDTVIGNVHKLWDAAPAPFPKEDPDGNHVCCFNWMCG